MREYVKDPDAVLPYSWDWSQFLPAGETIDTSSVIVPAGLTLDSETNTTTTATGVISGGSAGTRYVVTCRITTTPSAYVDDRSVAIRVEDR